jgi:hypothetical protein
MQANFEIIINKILTGTSGELSDVIKKVEFTVKGTQEGSSFELPQIVDLTEPEAAEFKPLSEVSQEDVIDWIVDNFDSMPAVESHIQSVLTKEVAKAALESKPLPWQAVLEKTED